MVDLFYRVLEGLGYHHPVHVLVTHMPIGMVTAAFALLLVAVIFRKEILTRSARHVFILALVFAVPTIIAGFMDWAHFYKGAWIPAITAKIILASILTVVLVAGAILGKPGKAGSPVMLGIYGLAFLCVVGLGYFGGNLVFGEEAATAGDAGPKLPEITASPADLKVGEALFVANCQSCHPKGGNVIEADRPLKKSEKLESLPAFIGFIRKPLDEDGQPTEMPTFTPQKVSDQQAGQLHGYLVDTIKKGTWR
jgi:mono/diheme cytochrome c family protein